MGLSEPWAPSDGVCGEGLQGHLGWQVYVPHAITSATRPAAPALREAGVSWGVEMGRVCLFSKYFHLLPPLFTFLLGK